VFQKIVDEVLAAIPNPADQSMAMRHAFLYLAFPDFYERSVSTRDKRQIVESFHERLNIPIQTDLDETISQIRQKLEEDPDMPHPFDFYNSLVKPLWRERNLAIPNQALSVAEEPEVYELESETLSEVKKLFAFTKNIILYGPPGTGKTYFGNLVAKEIVKQQLQLPTPENVILQSIVESNPLYDIVALSMYDEGKEKHISVGDLAESALLRMRNSARPINTFRESIWGTLQNHTTTESQTVKTINRSEPYLFDKDDKSNWYLTKFGKTYVEENLHDLLQKMHHPIEGEVTSEDFISMVSFHQSYSYEDFIEGYRPVGNNEIEIVPGKFREICSKAATNPNTSYVLIIDEINRGNISKIFGELITLIEDDKRTNQKNAMEIELAYSHNKFSVPDNLYIIGTMNTADRSIALLDVALRRRFAFVELLPNPTLLHGKIISDENNESIDLELLLQTINIRISKQLGKDYQIGHSYFLKINSFATLEFVWNFQILPMLEEYFYNQPETLAEILGHYLNEGEDVTYLIRTDVNLIPALKSII
jgi:5-methylcytosine-specific restriction protein B